MPAPLTEGKAFHALRVMGIVIRGITIGRVTAAVVDAPDFEEITIAGQADNRIVAPEVAGLRPVIHPNQFERDCHAQPGDTALGKPKY